MSSPQHKKPGSCVKVELWNKNTNQSKEALALKVFRNFAVLEVTLWENLPCIQLYDLITSLYLS